MFQKGKVYHRQNDIHSEYGGNRQSGIASSGQYPYVFLFSSPRGEEFGYKDGWTTDGQFLYTGEGQLGDMEMVRGNRAIRDHSRNGKSLHLFEKSSSGFYEYIGEFECVDHDIETGPDAAGKQRKVIRFRLREV